MSRANAIISALVVIALIAFASGIALVFLRMPDMASYATCSACFFMLFAVYLEVYSRG